MYVVRFWAFRAVGYLYNPPFSVCMASTSQAGCPSTVLEPARGAAYVQEVPEANLLHFTHSEMSQ